MAPAKKYLVKLRLLPSFLETLPVFAAPKPKSRAKKLAADDKKGAASPKSSPAPQEETSVGKINTGPKELSTAGLTVNTVTQALDKSGKPCRKWKKGRFQFKTFSGFKIDLGVWTPDVIVGEAGEKGVKKESAGQNGSENGASGPGISAASSPSLAVAV